ncbi:MAG: hypothetical protein RRY34_05940, partial [Victivallaceae bacterium]
AFTNEIPEKIFINGMPGVIKDDKFSGGMIPKAGFNKIRIDAANASLEAEFYYDDTLEKRYNFFIDDNSFALTEITRKRPKSIFDIHYLGKLKEFHEKYQACFTLNTFFGNDHDTNHWTLEELPTEYRPEWEANSNWLKIAFHANSEFPDAPYGRAFPEQYQVHHRKFIACARTKFGPNTLIEPVLTHFYDISDAASRHYAAAQGMRFYCARQDFFNDLQQRYKRKFTAVYNFEFKQFMIPVVLFCNLENQTSLAEKLSQACAEPHTTLINIGSHEQYSFEYYSNYIPDHFERIELALKIFAKYHFKPTFFTDSALCGFQNEKA